MLKDGHMTALSVNVFPQFSTHILVLLYDKLLPPTHTHPHPLPHTCNSSAVCLAKVPISTFPDTPSGNSRIATAPVLLDKPTGFLGTRKGDNLDIWSCQKKFRSEI